MRITILTLGSRGDVQPFLALAVGLKQAGYTVRLASHAVFEALIRSHGIDFALVRFNPQAIVDDPQVQAARTNIVRFMLAVRRRMGAGYQLVFDDFWRASQGAEAIIASPTASNAYDCAQTLGVPLIIGMMQPLIPTRAFSSFFLPPLPAGGGVVNQASHHLFNQLLWQNARSSVNRWRKARLGLGPGPFFGPYRAMRRAKVVHLVACSPAIIPKPADWPEGHYMTGYWFLAPPDGFRPPPGLEQFLQSGPPPVYAGLGSMAREQPEKVARAMIEALAQTGQRAILGGEWPWSALPELPEGMHQVREIPHHWLFPRMAALVHHGGAGTTAAALRAGVPSVVVPFGGDQPHWGRILLKAGVAPAVLPVDDLTAGSLAEALAQAIGDQKLRRQASALGALIRQEDGVSRAVALLGQLLVDGVNAHANGP